MAEVKEPCKWCCEGASTAEVAFIAKKWTTLGMRQYGHAQCRPVPRVFPTNMALRDGLPVTASATALFMLAAQREIRPVGPADFLISGLFRNASVRTAAVPTGPAAWRVAVDLPPDFCGAATLGLADPTGGYV